MTAIVEPATRTTSTEVAARRWQPCVLALICALSAALYLWGIGGSWGNTYYSAAVKSMSRSFENFFFGSFDSAGVVTVDKPPMALWAQVLSTKLFGFNQFALLFPQAVAGVAAVFLLHRTVRRWAGEHAALLAALVLALTPITVVINQDNNPDTLLVLLVVAAAYALTRAIEGRGSTAWVALAAFLVGCGFLTKMLQAWMVLPAFLAAYLIGSRRSWGRRALDLGVAGVVLLVSSFWWVAATALWPGTKPFIGGSTDGSAWDLVFGYNGFGRVFGQGPGRQGGSGPPPGMATDQGRGAGPGAGQGGPGGGFSGEPGVLRLFNEQLAGQISWLLPLCALVLIAVAVAGVRFRGMSRQRVAGWALWGGWLLTLAVVFSFASGTMHPYYTTMLAPAVGAVTGAGLVRFWRWYREPVGWSWLLLPLAVAVTAVWAFLLVARNPDWHAWAGYLAMGLGVLAVVALIVGRGQPVRLARGGLVLGLAAILTVPTAWSALGASSESAMGGTNPMAGPSTGMFPGGSGRMPGGPADQAGQRPPGGSGSGGPPQMRGGPAGMDGEFGAEQRALVSYVREQAGDRAVPLAVEGGAMSASSYIINTDLTVVGMGGFTGGDDAPSVAQLTTWQWSGQLGFVLLGGGPGGMARGTAGGGSTPGSAAGQMANGPGGEASGQRQTWVTENCTLVDPTAYGGDGARQLYDCR